MTVVGYGVVLGTPYFDEVYGSVSAGLAKRGVPFYDATHIGSIDVMLAQRCNNQTGEFESYGISVGRLGKVGTILDKPVGTVTHGENEALRDLVEELPGDWASELRLQTLKKVMRPLKGGQFLVRTNDANQVHAATYYGAYISEKFTASLELSSGTDEIMGVERLSFTLFNDLDKSQRDWNDKLDTKFFVHAHERLAVMAFLSMYWHDVMNDGVDVIA